MYPLMLFKHSESSTWIFSANSICVSSNLLLETLESFSSRREFSGCFHLRLLSRLSSCLSSCISSELSGFYRWIGYLSISGFAKNRMYANVKPLKFLELNCIRHQSSPWNRFRTWRAPFSLKLPVHWNRLVATLPSKVVPSLRNPNPILHLSPDNQPINLKPSIIASLFDFLGSIR